MKPDWGATKSRRLKSLLLMTDHHVGDHSGQRGRGQAMEKKDTSQPGPGQGRAKKPAPKGSLSKEPSSKLPGDSKAPNQNSGAGFDESWDDEFARRNIVSYLRLTTRLLVSKEMQKLEIMRSKDCVHYHAGWCREANGLFMQIIRLRRRLRALNQSQNPSNQKNRASA